MTMKRTDKKTHTVQLINAAQHGFTAVDFQSPKLRRAAQSDRGHAYMTGPEYAQHRMDRGAMHASRLALEIELRSRVRRMQRILGGRRVTGLAAGTKTPAAWTVSGPERERRRAA